MFSKDEKQSNITSKLLPKLNFPSKILALDSLEFIFISWIQEFQSTFKPWSTSKPVILSASWHSRYLSRNRLAFVNLLTGGSYQFSHGSQMHLPRNCRPWKFSAFLLASRSQSILGEVWQVGKTFYGIIKNISENYTPENEPMLPKKGAKKGGISKWKVCLPTIHFAGGGCYSSFPGK